MLIDNEDLHREHLYIDGAWVRPSDDRRAVTVVNPATGKPAGRAPLAGVVDLERAVAAARRALSGPWADTAVGDRAALLGKLADAYERAGERLGDLITVQNGSPLRWARPRQIPHPLGILRWHAEPDGRLLAQLSPEERGPAIITREPVGVVVAIVPWNMPQKTIMMKVAPALLAGCTVVVKPAEETPLDALALAGLAHDIGLPPGVLNVVPASRHTADWLSTLDCKADKIAFTGSTEVGRTIAARCGSQLRRCSTELGGKSPSVVFADADLDAWAHAVADDCLGNTGQVCSNHTRILVERPVYRRLLDLLTMVCSGLTVGHPDHPDTDLGPLVSERQRLRVQRLVNIGTAEGAYLHYAGPAPDGPGWWFGPTVLIDVDARNTLFQEEVFGPVLTVTPFDGDEQAIALANDSRYGLEAGVWTGDGGRAAAMVRQLRAGTVRVNGAPTGLDTPLGGFRESGIGRELGYEGVAGYVETKAIGIAS